MQSQRRLVPTGQERDQQWLPRRRVGIDLAQHLHLLLGPQLGTALPSWLCSRSQLDVDCSRAAFFNAPRTAAAVLASDSAERPGLTAALLAGSPIAEA